MFFEKLETRRFLSVALEAGSTPQYVKVAQDSGGKVTVNTTGGSKAVLNVAVSEDHGTLVVTEFTTGATWDVTNATQIVIQGTKSNDTIFYAGNTKGATVTGGSGDDFITVADTGTGSSVVDAGKGNDTVNLEMGNVTHSSGGSGNDVIFVNSGVGVYDTTDGDAIVDGGGGNDVIVIYDGHNTVNGGKGDDAVLEFGGTTSVTSASITVA